MLPSKIKQIIADIQAEPEHAGIIIVCEDDQRNVEWMDFYVSEEIHVPIYLNVETRSYPSATSINGKPSTFYRVVLK